MSSSLAERIIAKIHQVDELYHRLILVVGPSGGHKTTALMTVADQQDLPYINVNLELSRRLLELTVRQRALQIPKILVEVLGPDSDQTVVLDNLELLFDVDLKQDPLRLLQGLSRNRVVIASWNGIVKNGYLIYAEPDHREYRHLPLGDLTVVSAEEAI